MVDKQYILEEIKRTAKANGGKPLGKERFYRETDVNESDWAGKHWARWSDAIREAGFAPNQMQKARDKNELVEKFIELMRELGHFPVATEIKLKARQDKGFPWHNTFARFGSKQQFARHIQDYCTERAGYEDIISLCTTITKDQPTSDDMKLEECTGIVYLMKSGRNYKIGFTNDLARREREIRIELPDKLETVHWFRTDDASGIEAYWKNRFKAKCKNGEWFDLTSQDIRAFKRRKTFM